MLLGTWLGLKLYGKLNELTGADAAQIKKTYGALSNVQNEVTGRLNVNARQSPVRARCSDFFKSPHRRAI